MKLLVVNFIVLVSMSSCSKGDITEIETEAIVPSFAHFPIRRYTNKNTDTLITTDAVRQFFSVDTDDIIISGHRGGNLKGYPENCLETFMKVRSILPTFFEVDPRKTADGKIILMHDETIDRTTTGKGKVKELTYAEINKYYLKDRWGNPTEYKVPLLEDVIKWSKDKVILNFDDKGVPPSEIIAILDSLDAHNCIFTVHSVSKTKQILALSSDILFSAFMGAEEKFEDYRRAGLLNHVVVAFVESSKMEETKKQLYRAIRQEGKRCMVSTAPDQDIIPDEKERKKMYWILLDQHPDIVETDMPIDFAF